MIPITICIPLLLELELELYLIDKNVKIKKVRGNQRLFTTKNITKLIMNK